jgi:hypothetical protein
LAGRQARKGWLTGQERGNYLQGFWAAIGSFFVVQCRQLDTFVTYYFRH